MPFMKLFIFLVLAAALNPSIGIEGVYGPGDAFKSTTSLGDGKARVTTYSSTDKLVPYIVYELRVNSTPLGDLLFEKDIGLRNGLEILLSANEFVLNTLYKGLMLHPRRGNAYHYVEAIFESFSEAGLGGYPLEVASTVDNYIRINSDYLVNFDGDVRYEFTGIIYHESTHIWQNYGNGMAPAGLITGIADFVRLKAGLPSVNWRKRGEGERWDQGYEVTAYFLEYLDKLKVGSVANLNALMKDYYYDFYFDVIYGTNVEILWIEYKISSIVPIITCAPAPAPAV